MEKHIKITKKFYSQEEDLNTWVFYIEERLWEDKMREKYAMSCMKLLAISNVALKNNEIVKDRYGDLEHYFDQILL